jgi:VanZ family protein
MPPPSHRILRTPDAAQLRAGHLATACLIYALFVVYGSLVPLDYQPRPLADAWAAFQQIPYLRLGVASRADWVANILLYVPLAFFGTGAITTGIRSGTLRVAGVLVVASACVALAFAVEFAQLFFPPRTVSQNDLIAETLGTFIGIALWIFVGTHLSRLWQVFGAGGIHSWQAFAALYAIAYLAYSLFPYDFLVSAAELQQKLASSGLAAFTAAESCGPMLGCATKLVVEIAVAAPLGALLGRAFPALGVRAALISGLALGLAIEALQILLASGISQGLSVLTRGIGMAWGLALQRRFRLRWLWTFRHEIRLGLAIAVPIYLALLAYLNGFSGSFEPVWAAADKLSATRFLPFYYHYYTSETAAVASLLGNAGAYALVGVAVWLWWPDRKASWLTGGIATLIALGVECLKLFTPGKKPDPTNLLIAFAAAWLVSAALSRLSVATSSAHSLRLRRPAQLPLGMALGGTVTLVAVVIGGLLLASPKYERAVDESVLPQLPPGEELPEAVLPGFRFQHPRLPHPSVRDLATLTTENPAFLRDAAKRADGGKGNLEAVILQAFIEPGSVDLDLLQRRLLELKPDWRGHDQVKPLALAYDWLQDQWTGSQRLQLLDKVVAGCNFIIDVIRKERLSPYNVYLYNSPFQALVACSLAVYGDDPRADPVMRFTDDLWRNRVLPVWRQIMGRNGGWHEGGEYVGIGIGQAVHQVPAMWRSATGEDFFATEPGIRGFLDFLVYRAQPDGSHFRWGDAGFFDRIVPDATPLALEYRHPAAYALRPPGKGTNPTGWPWGPFTDPTLHDPTAISRLPLVRFFDGIGLVVARNDWTTDATYVTFKAGDNYWSHSHLDQGAFTIYKGGPLAIDSGIYGPAYGADHHMNYAYQAIAHNTVTVTDPTDTVPAPGKEKPRPIANDGGQRRIGSGWGVEAAPLDLAEWRTKRDTYHAGTMERVFDGDGLTVAVADVTPAYTNGDSGEGTFSHRTRRVERFWRTFGYDRVDDVVVVFDIVEATEASFRKAWLLHSIDEPRLAPDGFRVSVAPQKRPGRAGGNLEAKVLLPKDATINIVGGPGFEFFVDDRNYDENGTLWEAVQKRPAPAPEPGAWRVELSPSQDARDDHFLVVLLPTAAGVTPEHRVRLLQDGNRVGCEVVGPKRTSRWWFDRSVNGPIVEILDTNGVRQQDVRVTAPPGR